MAAIFIAFLFGSYTQAADTAPPEVISKQFSSSTIAYKGNAVPGYVTITLETDEPSRGYIMAVGNNGRQAKINLSTTEFKTKHVVHWAPWDDVKREPLPPGTYLLKSYLTDASYNSAQGFPLGQIIVVQEPNPKELITVLSTTPSTISPKYSETQNLMEMKYELSRHAEVQIAVQKDGTIHYQTGKVKLEPGTHQFAWNGRDQKGNIVPDGEYEIVFKTIELNYNYPAATQTVFKAGKINVVNGEHTIPEWRMKEIVTSVSLYVGQKLTIPGKQPAETYTIYTVQSGDSLWKIAQKYNTTIQKIVDLNQIDVNNPILVGQKLKVPSA
ncbi:LysM peptidoglycan-binding domain-containing protein [Bacillus alveayuensis]|jgi:hypothetical protein|uniref:LysM peptidoglycan-binding domain-containing protein n=1 Tax=Aeribacillus alveayuensis TaxID=279215 RepID=UPI0005CD93FE|nr:LysM peptidoglycan-binding domain-containing protein [Bacillus alveayuensis]